jgi:FtsP/CotA-like multicopper oxidase with cupredoxin domain
VIIVPNAPVGTRLSAKWLPYDRGFGTAEHRVPEDLFYIDVTEDMDGVTPPPLPPRLREIVPIDVVGAHPQNVSFDLLGSEYTINGRPFGGGEAGMLHAVVGRTDLWTVVNLTQFDHPFHLHGFFFQVLDETTGLPVAPREWKNTVNVPQKQQLQLAVTYDDRPGMWMFHCHVLDHADVGLMGMLHVAPRN